MDVSSINARLIEAGMIDDFARLPERSTREELHMKDPNKPRDDSTPQTDPIEYEQEYCDTLDSCVNSDDDEGEDPFGNPIVDTWSDDDGETWYEDDNGDTYTEEMGPPCNWPDHD
ncbi:MAG: hypothetical protein EOM62_11925 [Bacteroidia bacterium]|nr:hypothetical protein [Bacteroidia bacterium]